MKRMRHYLLATAMIIILVWMALALIRVENERYLLWTGVCSMPGDSQSYDELRAVWHCLDTKQSRTNRFFHLIYALGIL